MSNAVTALVRITPLPLVRARLEREGLAAGGSTAQCTRRLRERYDVDLIGFLNGAQVAELRSWSAALALPVGTAGALRQRLWMWGAAAERAQMVRTGVTPELIDAIQAAPTLVGARLTLGRPPEPTAPLPAARAARSANCSLWPRPVPPVRTASEPDGEPASLDALLARADELIGVRLGTRGRDKGHYGQRVSELLGLARSSASTPDWRAEVEVKTLAVVRAGGGRWRLKDGPALSMRSVDANAKLARVLWVVRIDEGEVPNAPVLSWYYQELEPDLAAAFEAARHLRPKGGAGTHGRGWYLRRDFFDACGLMRSLNGI